MKALLTVCTAVACAATQISFVSCPQAPLGLEAPGAGPGAAGARRYARPPLPTLAPSARPSGAPPMLRAQAGA
jgi:hypothetical protein